MFVIPTHYKVIAGAALAALCALGVWAYGQARYAEGQQHERDQIVKADLKESQDYRKQEAVVDGKKDEAYDQYIKQRDEALRSADAARSELGRLRNDLAEWKRRAAKGVTPECPTYDPTPVVESLESCGARHQEMARDAELDAEQVIGLQNYIRSIAPLCIRGEASPN
jgi:hypothetical protein